MAYPSLPRGAAWVLVLIGSSVLTIAFVAWIIVMMPRSKVWLAAEVGQSHEGRTAAGQHADQEWPRAGVIMVVRGADGSEIVRSLPTASLSLDDGVPFDARVPADAVEAVFRIALRTGRVRDAHLGVQFSGGQVIVRVDDRIVIADAAGREVREAMTQMPVRLGPGVTRMSITFRRRGEDAMLLRALWKPEGALYPLRLPADGRAVAADAEVRGHALAMEFRCTACHVPGDLQRRRALAPPPAAVLAGLSERVHARWLEEFIERGGPDDRAAGRPACGISAADAGARERADLLHYLSLVKRLPTSAGAASHISAPAAAAQWEALVRDAGAEALAGEGAALFHAVGCVACHGPLDAAYAAPGAGVPGTPTPGRYAGMGDPAAKYPARFLAAYLRDPLAAHPDGRMPSLSLSDREAAAIAIYLTDRKGLGEDMPATGSRAAGQELPDMVAAMRGAAWMDGASCAACHAPPGGSRDFASSVSGAGAGGAGGAIRGEESAARRSALPAAAAGSAPALEAMRSWTAGCLGDRPAAPAPDFRLSRWEREDLRAWLEVVTQPLDADSARRIPVFSAHDELAAQMLRLRCTACHAYHADRGPEPAILAYFSSSEDADLGDEGRLPPELTDAGGRLSTAWMHQVLHGGERARPWLATRMPRYGEDAAGQLPSLFAAAAGASHLLSDEPAPRATSVQDGLRLVGARGLNCIECHGIAGLPSIGMPGPDLTQMPGRLQFSAFAQWLADPALLRPGTRMPSFFNVLGSPVTDVCGGWPECQIESMWTYLALGAQAPLPEGMTDPGGFDIDVDRAPVVFRSFMEGAGFRAIAVGFPEGVHAAYDADRQEMALVWSGRFLSARGAWGGRGGMPTDPDLVDWSLPEGHRTVTMLGQDGAPVPEAEVVRRFRGYRLDASGVPEFMSSIRHRDREARITLRPRPQVDRRSGARMTFAVRIEGAPGTAFTISVPDAFVSLGSEGRLELDSDGSATVLVEISR